MIALTDEEYVATSGTKCPHCGSTRIVAYDSNFDGAYASQTVCCSSCNATWSDVYKLIGFKLDGLEGETS